MKLYLPCTILLSILLFQIQMAQATAPPEKTDSTTGVTSQQINLSFDIEKNTAIGTSKIILPKNQGLTLYCQPLQITGTLLESGCTTPNCVKTDADGNITVPPSPQEQTLLLSWQLDTKDNQSYDNLITAEGITLAGHWHPIAAGKMKYSLEAKLPESLQGITESDALNNRKVAGNTIMQASFDTPVHSIHFAAGPYTVKERIVAENIELSTWFFHEDAQLADSYLDKAQAYLERYSKMIGPYPYKRFAIVANRLPTGYGMPTFTLLGQMVLRLPFIKDTSLGHEVLHSWFGNGVLLSNRGGNWCEGLTTYLADQLYAADKNEDAAYRKKQLLRYHAYIHSDNKLSLESFTGSGDNRPMARQRRAVGYDKASMLFHMLRQELSDEIFFNGLRDFYAQYLHQEASWQDIEKVFSQVSGKNLTVFFKQWLTRTDIPDLTIRDMSLKDSLNGSLINFNLIQATEKPYRLEVSFIVHSINGEQRHVVRTDQTETAVTLQSSALPNELILDPDYDLLRVLGDDEQRPIWADFIGALDKKMVLPPQNDRQNWQALITYLEKMGVQAVEADEVKNKDLADFSFLFLGESAASRSLFAQFTHSDKGFTLDVRNNPLNPQHVIVLVSSSSNKEAQAVLRKLSHYGQYSYLSFAAGRIQEKRYAPSDSGMRFPLLQEPSGIPAKRTLSFQEIISQIKNDRVVYVGETHTDYGNHLLQLQVIQALHHAGSHLAIGLEMFPRSSQPALDAWIAGAIDEQLFIKQSRYFNVWGYDYRLYQEIFRYARTYKIPLVGLNLDKKIVSTVFRNGHTDTLSTEQQDGMAAERDLDIAGYRDRLLSVHAAHSSNNPHAGDFSGFLQSQALWDETMAESVSNYLGHNPDRQMIVLAGTGHVYKDSAIPPRVARRLPGIQQSTLASTNSGETGTTVGKKLDYLLYTEPMELKVSPKIGVVLSEEKQDDATTIVRIVGISPHGKAGEAGLKEQDQVLTVDGRPVQTIGELKFLLLDKKAGDVVPMQVLRGENTKEDDTLEFRVELTVPSQASFMPPGHPKK